MTNAANGTQPHNLGFAIEHLRARWGEIVAFGALLVVLGVAALCFTLPSTVATVTLNGVFFLVAGVAEIGVGAHAKSWARFFLWIIGGAIYLVAGVVCIINPIFASLALTLALGAGLIAAAAVRAYLAFHLPAGNARAHGAARRGGHLPARPGHRRPLADGLPLRPGNPARRRFAVSWSRLGDLRDRPQAAPLTGPSGRRRPFRMLKIAPFERFADDWAAARIFSPV